MTPRFVKQKDKFRCGPIAIINALRWAGIDIKYNEVKPIGELCGCVAQGGCVPIKFDLALRKKVGEYFKVKLVAAPIFPEIEEHLRSNGIIVLYYRWVQDSKNKTGCHYTLITGISDSGGTVYIVNRSRIEKTFRGVRRKTFMKWELRFRNVYDPEIVMAWFLSPKKGRCCDTN